MPRSMAMWMGFGPCSAMLLAVASLTSSPTARAEDTHPSSPQTPAAPATRDDSDAALPAATQPATSTWAFAPLRNASDAGLAIPDVPDSFATRRWTLETHAGIATPVGEFGLESEYSPHPIVGLGIGVGLGAVPKGANAFRGTLLARLRPFRGKKNALVLGAAYAFGGYARFDVSNFGESAGDTPPLADRTKWAHWAQFDVGWERRATSGFLLRMSVGGAFLLNPADLECSPEDAARCVSVSSQTLFTLDFAVGYAGPV